MAALQFPKMACRSFLTVVPWCVLCAAVCGTPVATNTSQPLFTLSIPEARDMGGGLYGLTHGDHFTLVLVSTHPEPCEVEIRIAGEDVGGFRMHPHTPLVLERPAHAAKKFAFFKSGTPEASAGRQPEAGSPLAGLVEATFLNPPMPPPRNPEAAHRAVPWGDWGPEDHIFTGDMPTGAAMHSGSVSLQHDSHQRFHTVDPLSDETWDRTTLRLRLVCLSPDDNDITPLQRTGPEAIPTPI